MASLKLIFLIVGFAFFVTASAEESIRTRRNVGTCGISKVLSGLVIRGTEIRRGEFPWIVAFIHTGFQPARFFCSGTLISSTFVVTTAHCILQKISSRQLLPEDIITIFGVYKLDDPYEVEREVLRPEKIIIHEDWNHLVSSYDADIALVQFEEGKININHVYINPICTWDSTDDPLASDGVVMGWGKSEDETKRHEVVPKLTKVKIQYNDECLAETPRLAEMASKRTFCAGNKNGSGVCKGDSGGGLFIKIDGVYYLKGIVSSSLVTDGSCDISKYAVYTNIHKFTDWIKQKTRGAFSTSAKALIDVFCTLRLKFSYHHARRIQSCVIETAIDNDFFVIANDPIDSVLGFTFHRETNAKFLPRYIGDKFSHLEELTASGYSLSIIRSFYFDNMRNVRFIDLSFNQIAVVEKASFKDLFSVKYLFLANNKIDTLDKDLFRSMVNLKYLDLTNNNIDSLNPATFKILGGKLLEANLLSNVCVNGSYEVKDFVRLGDQIRNNCELE